MKDFNLTDRAEFLHDYAGAINGNYLHYIYKNNIEDDNNIIMQNRKRVVALKNRAYYIEDENEYNQIKDELDRLDKELPNE